jgi:hypothetical protein
MMTEPLKWCVDWGKLSTKEKFLMGAPFVATEDRAYKDIVQQLAERTEADIEQWNSFPQDVSSLAKDISMALKADGIWPSSIFLPDDPADVPLGHYFDFTDKWDLLPASLALVEKEFGIEMDNGFWDRLSEMTYAQAVTEISRRKAE